MVSSFPTATVPLVPCLDFFARSLPSIKHLVADDVDEEEQNLAPKFLFTSADLEVTEGIGRS